MNKTRDEAYKLLTDWVKSEALIKHMLAVEAAMRAYAKKFEEDEDLWGITGLIHDFDYEKYPNKEHNRQGHPFPGVEELKKQGYPQEMIEAILGHALYSGTPRVSKLAKTLFACDELCGFVVACAKVRPEGFSGMKTKSVKKKLKDKRFAATVSREDIAQGIKEMEVDETEHIQFVIGALAGIADKLGFSK